MCAIALKNSTVDREVRRIIENSNYLPPVSQNSEKFKEKSEPNFHPKKWVSELFMQARQEFNIDTETNPECKRDFELYKMHLQNQSVWAIRSKYYEHF